MDRIDRVNAELQKQIADIINNEIKDPRVNGLVSVVKVDTARDLAQAKIYISFLADEGNEAFKAIKGASKFIRGALAKRVDIRSLPELFFIKDNSIEYGVKLTKIINEVNKKVD